jgi:hypothetical protein
METTAFVAGGMLQLKFLKERKDAAENIPTKQSSSRQNARISSAHEDSRRTVGFESQTRQGAEAHRGETLLALED